MSYDVTDIQIALNKQGFKGANGKTLVPDGVMGFNSEHAIMTALGQADARVPKPEPADYPRGGFELSNKSVAKLVGVKPNMQAVVKLAIKLSAVDFSVGEGLRSTTRQKALVASGASQTMASKHITGDAVDLFAYVGGKVSWNVERDYIQIATAMVRAASELGVAVKWGAAWSEGDIRQYVSDPDAGKNMMGRYAALRKSQGRKAFIDAVHFELM